MRSRPRAHGRLGIDTAATRALPPLSPSAPTSPSAASPRSAHAPHLHGSMPALQQRERLAMLEELQQRLAINQHLISRAGDMPHMIPTDSRADQAIPADDCFGAVKRALDGHHEPTLARFLLDLVGKIEDLARERLQSEANRQRADLRLHAPANMDERIEAHADRNDDEHGITSDDASSSDSSGDDGAPRAHEAEAREHSATAATTTVLSRPVRFRARLRCRRFLPSRVPASEYVREVTSATPFEYRATADLAALRLRQDGRADADGFAPAEWVLVRFPQARPRLRIDHLDAFKQWATAKLDVFRACTTASSSFELAQEMATMQTRFQSQLDAVELVCFELSRLVFDQSPTAARFLHGLVVAFTTLAQRTLAEAAREADVLLQRHTNVQLDLARLQEQHDQVQAALETLQQTLTTRDHQLAHERARTIHRRNRINLLLCADQVLARQVTALLLTAEDLADDALREPPDEPPGEAALAVRFDGIDALMDLIATKFGALPEVEQCYSKWRDTQAATSQALESQGHATAASISRQHVNSPSEQVTNDASRIIVVTSSDVETALAEFTNTRKRLARVLATKTPDCSIGWDPQELWDQALFLPPFEDVQDLERDVQRLCRQVEARIVRDRQAPRPPSQDIAVQTDLSACIPTARRSRLVSIIAAADVLPMATKSTADFASLSPFQAATTTPHEDVKAVEVVFPAGLQRFVSLIPRGYEPHQFPLATVHSIISFLFNEMWTQIHEEFRRPRVFAAAPTPPISLLPLTTIHEALHRTYLHYFREPSAAMCCLADLLTSARNLDTQSCKVLLFSRLVGLPGVAKLPSHAFWFVLKALHVLQQACASSGRYFLLDADEENEFVPHTSASEALGQLFVGASMEVLKRLRLKLAGLASVYGTVWIPVYHVLALLVDEWKIAQDTLRQQFEHKLRLEFDDDDNDEAIDNDNKDSAGHGHDKDHNRVVTLNDFVQGCTTLGLCVHRLEAVSAYRCLLRASMEPTSDSLRTPGTRQRFSLKTFYHRWLDLAVRTLHQAQHQLRPQAGASSSATTAGMHLGSVADALLLAQRRLALRFLVASWDRLKPDLLARLHVHFHDTGLPLRLVQAMDVIAQDRARSATVGWTSLQQLISLAWSPLSQPRDGGRGCS